ncbi:hypothetical protein KEM52_001541 [Ascosphaera acerosa]|nr:hypothetical protein KEM52_001541 [Ascosphaera acerosa]
MQFDLILSLDDAAAVPKEGQACQSLARQGPTTVPDNNFVVMPLTPDDRRSTTDTGYDEPFHFEPDDRYDAGHDLSIGEGSRDSHQFVSSSGSGSYGSAPNDTLLRSSLPAYSPAGPGYANRPTAAANPGSAESWQRGDDTVAQHLPSGQSGDEHLTDYGHAALPAAAALPDTTTTFSNPPPFLAQDPNAFTFQGGPTSPLDAQSIMGTNSAFGAFDFGGFGADKRSMSTIAGGAGTGYPKSEKSFEFQVPFTPQRTDMGGLPLPEPPAFNQLPVPEDHQDMQMDDRSGEQLVEPLRHDGRTEVTATEEENG